MSERPYVLLSCAMSIDGYIDDASESRLLLSGDADLDRVDEVRAGCDAILVGAVTIRRDNPRLLVRSPARRADRVARGLAPSPARVTLTSRGDLDPAAQFFKAEAPAADDGTRAGAGAGAGDTGRGSRIVYVASPAVHRTRERLGQVADVAEAGDPIDLRLVLGDLASRGIGKLMVEGGGSVHTQFLAAGLADELQLAVAPFFVGDSSAPRFVTDGGFPWNARHPARLAEVSRLGDVALLRYALSGRYPAR